MVDSYFEIISLVERVSRNYLKFLGSRLDQIGSGDINSVQAFILLNVGEDKVTVNELRNRINYLETRINQIVRKLIENGYLLCERSQHDRRIINVWLSCKGSTLCTRLIQLHEQYSSTFPDSIGGADVEITIFTLRKIEQFWIDQALDR
jgi:DNA-binding MarR family transcriptional regulator